MKAFYGGVLWALVFALIVCERQAGADFVRVSERHAQPRVLYVLAIGISDYAQTPIADVPGAAAEAQILAGVLKERATSRYDVVEVVELVDRQATRTAVLQALNRAAARLKAEDVFVFYFSGHALDSERSHDGESYLAPHDAGPLSEKSPALTGGVSAADFHAALEGMPAKQRLLLFDSIHFDVRMSPEGTHVIQAAGPGGMAFASSDGGRFTKILLQALQGWGDADQDGRVSVFELAGFVGRHLPALDSPSQIPAIALHGMDFPLVIKDVRRVPELADKLDAGLVNLIRVQESEGMAGVQAFAAEHQMEIPDGLVEVLINAVSTDALGALRDEVVRRGGSVQTEFENVLYAALPIEALKDFVMQEAVWRVDWSRQVFAPPSFAPSMNDK